MSGACHSSKFPAKISNGRYSLKHDRIPIGTYRVEVTNAWDVSVEQNFITFSTALFVDEQSDDELDQWFLGEDCAKWLHSKLLTVEGIIPGVEPLQEDWGGWTFGVQSHGVWFWINIWPGLRGRRAWTIGIEPRPGPFGMLTKKRTRLAKARLCEAIDSALRSSQEITDCQWFDKHPSP